MKISVAVASLVVLMCCMEVALGYPRPDPLPRGRPNGVATARSQEHPSHIQLTPPARMLL